jgi:hypothetical protein
VVLLINPKNRRIHGHSKDTGLGLVSVRERLSRLDHDEIVYTRLIAQGEAWTVVGG